MVRQVPEVGREPGIAAALEALRGRRRAPRRVHLSRASRGRRRIPSSTCACLARALATQSRLRRGRSRHCARRLALRPEFAPLHEDLGGVLACRRRFEEAVAELRDGAAARPAPPARRQEAGRGARGARARHARRMRHSRDGSSRTRPRGRSRLRSTTCAPGRKDEAIATLRSSPARRSRTTSMPCTRSRRRYWDDEKPPLGRRGAAAPRDGARARPRRCLEACSARCCTKRTGPRRPMRCYLQRSRLEPDNASGWSGLGANYAQIGDMEQSARRLRAIASRCNRACRHPA